jgi:Mor family transcriptional regulator
MPWPPGCHDERDAQIHTAWLHGVAIDDIARTHHLTASRVYQILKQIRDRA